MSVFEYTADIRECDIPRIKRNKLEDLACDLLRSHRLLEAEVIHLRGVLFNITEAVSATTKDEADG